MAKTRKPFIKPSWFPEHEYCEYKWYFHNVLKEKVIITRAMVKGEKIHRVKEEHFLKKAVPISMEEFLASTEYTITKEIRLRKEFDDFIMMGRLDELAVDRDNIYVIDDKPKAYPWHGIKRQLWAYCILFKEKYPQIQKTIIAVLRDRDTNNEVWEKEFKDEDRKEVFQVIHRMLQLLRKEVEPIPCDNSNKCRACALHKKGICEYSCN